jgi:signal transduction histidine kinase
MTNFVLIEVDIQTIIESSLESVQDLAAKQHVKLTSTAPACMVIADDQRTIQVLVNLLGNALKFSPEHSSIVVSSVDRQDKLEVRVTDQGRGIPPDLVDKIFNRFQQVERNDQTRKGGVGLGLAICKAIVHGQGGEIGVTSELGKGSTFWFTVRKVSDSAGAHPD